MKRQHWGIIAAVLFAFVFILLIFTAENANPLNTRWVTTGGGDYLQHYLGWRFFRNSPWTGHFLFMQNWNYPEGTSVIVTDSNPLFSLLFKLFAGVLPAEFQFSGIWIVFCFCLNALISALIIRKITDDPIVIFAGSVLAVLNPVVLQRALIHDTLTAHWLILMAVYLFADASEKWNPAGWFLLCGLTMLVHIYFLPMILFILGLQVLRMAVSRVSFVKIALPVGAAALSCITFYFGLGYNYIMPQSGSYGELSLNLNAFFNPDGVSVFLADRPTLPLQYEGFNYFGLGLLILLAAAIAAGNIDYLKRISVYIIPSLLLILLAASNEVYFDQIRVFSFSLPEGIREALSIFRSSGRLVWPLYYLVLFSAVFVLSGNLRCLRVPAAALLLCCVLIQVLDLRGFMAEAAERFRDPSNPMGTIPEELSASVPECSEHLFLSCDDSKMKDAFALYAADHKMTMNLSTNARGIRRIFGRDRVYMEELTCPLMEAKSVYIYDHAAFDIDAFADCEGTEAKVVNGGWLVITMK